jgi:ADP-heptose:LPS heptosyltransferase
MTPGTLLIRFGSLGDVILSFAAGRTLRAAHPDDPLTFVVKETYADLVAAQPWVDEVMPLTAADRGAMGAIRLRGQLAAGNWKRILDLQDSPRSRFLALGLGATASRWQRLRRERRAWVRDRDGEARRPAAVRPAWLRFQDAAGALGARPGGPPVVSWGERAEQEAGSLWQEWGVSAREQVVGLVPAAAWPTKEWPEFHSLALARSLVRGGARVLVVSTSAERQRLPVLSRWAEEEPAVLWFCDRLLPIAALLARCCAAVTPDSGLMHLAAAVATPVVALFGSTVPELGFAPPGEGHTVLVRGLPCQPCALHGRQRCPLGHLDCLAGLAPEEVLTTLRRTLLPGPAGPPL